MKIDGRQKICDLVNQMPTAARILGDLGIEPFRNSNRTLWDACTNSGIPIGRAVEQLKKAEEAGREHKYPLSH